MTVHNSLRMFLAVFIYLLTATSVVHSQYSGGTGEPNDPYQIATAADLIALGETPDDYDEHFILTADIDLDPNLPGRRVFDRAVIAPDTNDVTNSWGNNQFDGVWFTGIFDGNDHTVSNLTIDGESHLGLFGRLGSGANVSDLGLEHVDVNGTGRYVGSLVGMNDGGHIANCHSTGTVSGTGSFIGGVGGLVGTNGSWGWGGSSVTNCYSTGIVIGDSYVGGLVGVNVGGSITMSYSTSMVSGEGFVGGLVGSNEDGNVTASHSSGTVAGGSSVGGLVGWSNGAYAYVTDCRTTGMVSGMNLIGGLVGNNEGPVVACYSTANVSGESVVGGLVGENDQSGVSAGALAPYGSITTSYSIGRVNGGEVVGGLVGCNYGGYVADCYSTGEVDGDQAVGGLVGYSECPVEMDKVRVISSFWDVETSGLVNMCGRHDIDAIDCHDSLGKITAEMQVASTFLEAGWDFVGEIENGPNDVWKIVEGKTYPLLSWQKYGGGTGEPNDPYLIYTAEHLNALGAEPNDYDKHFKLMADIDLSGYSYDRAVIAPEMNDFLATDYWGWPEYDGAPFTGVFDGNGHTISHLTIEGASYLGMFGRLGRGATISHLGLEAVDVNGVISVGGLAGTNGGGNEAGGVVTGCYCTGIVSGENRIGGLVGFNSGDIARSYSMGMVRGNENVGGLVGYNYNEIEACYCTGMVSGNSQVGGLVGGMDDCYIRRCYSWADVRGGSCVGGLVGFNDLWGNIIMSYSAGMVSGDSEMGGLVGVNKEGCTSNSFWDAETSGCTTMCGRSVWEPDHGHFCIHCYDSSGLTTAEMQTASTFIEAGWDFIDETVNGTDDIWWILEGLDYPRLWWEDAGAEF